MIGDWNIGAEIMCVNYNLECFNSILIRDGSSTIDHCLCAILIVLYTCSYRTLS